MELRQIRYFVGVCEAGSLLQAASRLHIAQPALGQHITELERQLGATLFVRSNRGMVPTEAGRRLLEHARILLADVERARQAVHELVDTPQGTVSVGLPTTVALAVTLPLLHACRRQYPNVQLKIVEAYSGFLVEWLRLGRLDVAVLFGDAPEPGLSKQAILDERLALVASPQEPTLPREASLQYLTRPPLVLPSREHGLRRILDSACTAANLTLQVVAEIDSLPSVKRAAETGIGQTVLSLASVAEEVQTGRLQAAPIAGPGMSRRVVCATHLTRPATVAADAVRQRLVQVIHELVQSGAWPAKLVG